MKLSIENNELEVFGTEEVPSSFSMSFNAKAFKVLSSTIYSNKIGSIVREYASNAWDSHVMASKPDEPFHIHLPNAFEPWFSVEDFGVGLSKEDVLSTYTVFFKSTKDQSNDCIGMIGIGSKSAFAYTDQFTITSKYNGTKTSYSAFISANGVPNVVEMHSENIAPTETNGVEIRMSVKREDYNRFSTEVLEQLKYFKVKPTLLNTSVKFPDETAAEYLYETDKCKVFAGAKWKDFVIVQGNVGYELNVENLKSSTAAKDYLKSIEFLNKFGSHTVLFNFPIGSIGVTASREGVEYDDKTVVNICKAIQELEQEFVKQLEVKVNSFSTDWEKAHYLQADPFNKNFIQHFKLKDEYVFVHNGYKLNIESVTTKEVKETVVNTFTNVPQILTKKITLGTVRGVATSAYNGRRNRGYDVKLLDVADVSNIVFIARDKNTLAERKMQYFFNNNRQYSSSCEIRAEEGTDLKQIITGLKALMEVDVKVVYLSEIQLPEEAKKPSIRLGNIQYYQYDRGFEHSIRQWNAIRHTTLDEVKSTVYYLTHDGAYVNSIDLGQALSCIKDLGLEPKDSLIAISEKKEVLVLNKPNFKTFEQLKKDAKKVLEDQKGKLIRDYRLMVAHHAFVANLRDIKFLPEINVELPKSELAAIFKANMKVNAKVNALNTQENLHSMISKLKTIGVDADKILINVQRHTSKISAIINKYPLLPVLSSWYCRDTAKAKDVVQYVKALQSTF